MLIPVRSPDLSSEVDGLAAWGHKTIALLKADDPIIVKAETRDGAFVAATLQVAQDKLEKAVGL